MVVCHGNGTTASDLSEGLALRSIFGANCPPITSFKWAFGHLIAASGSIDAVLCLLALQRGVVPGIGCLNELEPALTDLPFAIGHQEPRNNIGIVLCRGFGGRNTAIIIKASDQAQSK
jgi:3-oxoacyl-(acyl-carrier-protein) synthase